MFNFKTLFLWTKWFLKKLLPKLTRFGTLLRLLLALSSVLSVVPERKPLPRFFSSMEKVRFRFHLSDGYISYHWMQGNDEIAYLCYDLRNGVFTAQSMPKSFGMAKKARTYVSLLKHAISAIKEINRHETS